ncbi:hypothetical protein ACFOWE_04830 [Planomonospora corallina]|uniref:Uncharacterized protein n=1 Tax=Planomonospora corallina TaxID=1806052 RepID=A0ABV8I184_9ACTN
MPRQIAMSFQAPSTIELEVRVLDLEARVAYLTKLVETLSREHEDARS